MDFYKSTLNFMLDHQTLEPYGKRILFDRFTEDYPPELVFKYALEDISSDLEDEYVKLATIQNTIHKMEIAKLQVAYLRAMMISVKESDKIADKMKE